METQIPPPTSLQNGCGRWFSSQLWWPGKVFINTNNKKPTPPVPECSTVTLWCTCGWCWPMMCFGVFALKETTSGLIFGTFSRMDETCVLLARRNWLLALTPPLKLAGRVYDSPQRSDSFLCQNSLHLDSRNPTGDSSWMKTALQGKPVLYELKLMWYVKCSLYGITMSCLFW